MPILSTSRSHRVTRWIGSRTSSTCSPATAGRSAGTLTKFSVTYKAVLSIDSSADAARSTWDAWRRRRGIGEVDSTAGVFVGDPTQVTDQLEPWLDTGIEHFVFEVLGGDDPKTVTLAGETLAQIS